MIEAATGPVTLPTDGINPIDEDAFNQIAAALSEPEAEVKTRRVSDIKPKKSCKMTLGAKPFIIATPVLAALWLVLSFMTYFPSWSNAPGLSSLYNAFGVEPLDGLAFADVNMEREQEGSKTKFILSGSIRNNTSEARAVPTVRVLLKNKEDKILWSREYPVNTELKAGDVYPFRITNVETAFAKSVSSIVVDMGNSLQLMAR